MSGRLQAIVVDDEAPARRRLERLLDQLEVDVVASLGEPMDALVQVERRKPDIVFLDIHMPGLDGLALAERCAGVPVVFVTAHAEHAVRAFELDSVDYLLKPVRLERLEEAIRRARRVSPGASPRSGSTAPVVVHEHGTTLFVDPAVVTRFRASEKYTAFLAEGRELLTEESLVALEERLGPLGFVRVHRAELIRISAVRAFRVEDGAHSVRLEDGQVVPVSRRMVTPLRERLGGRHSSSM